MEFGFKRCFFSSVIQKHLLLFHPGLILNLQRLREVCILTQHWAKKVFKLLNPHGFGMGIKQCFYVSLYKFRIFCYKSISFHFSDITENLVFIQKYLFGSLAISFILLSQQESLVLMKACSRMWRNHRVLLPSLQHWKEVTLLSHTCTYFEVPLVGGILNPEPFYRHHLWVTEQYPCEL